MRAKPDVVCGVTASGRGSEIEGSRGGGEQDSEREVRKQWFPHPL